MAGRLAAAWRGEAPLPVAFWHYGVFWGVLVNLITSGIFWSMAAADLHAALLLPAYFLPLPYNVFVCVAIWRSAGRYTGPAHWAELARWGSLAGMLVLSLT